MKLINIFIIILFSSNVLAIPENEIKSCDLNKHLSSSNEIIKTQNCIKNLLNHIKNGQKNIIELTKFIDNEVKKLKKQGSLCEEAKRLTGTASFPIGSYKRCKKYKQKRLLLFHRVLDKFKNLKNNHNILNEMYNILNVELDNFQNNTDLQ